MVDGVALERLNKILVDSCVGVKGGVSELFKDVVEARGPFAGAEPRCDGAVVLREREERKKTLCHSTGSVPPPKRISTLSWCPITCTMGPR